MRQFCDSPAHSRSLTDDRMQDRLGIALPILVILGLAAIGVLCCNHSRSLRPSTVGVKPKPSALFKVPESPQKVFENFVELSHKVDSTSPPQESSVFELVGFYIVSDHTYFTFEGEIDSSGRAKIYVESDEAAAKLLFSEGQLITTLDSISAPFFRPLEGLVLSLMDALSGPGRAEGWNLSRAIIEPGTLPAAAEHTFLFQKQLPDRIGWTRLALCPKCTLPHVNWKSLAHGREFKSELSAYQRIAHRPIPFEILVEDDFRQRTKIYLRHVRLVGEPPLQAFNPMARLDR